MRTLRRLVRESLGQDLVEYALIAAAVSLVAIVVIRGISTGVVGALQTVDAEVEISGTASTSSGGGGGTGGGGGAGGGGGSTGGGTGGGGTGGGGTGGGGTGGGGRGSGS